MRESDAIVDTLKRLLRSRRITYADVAQQLELSEATVKRLFASRRFSLERLEQVASVVGYSVAELTAEASTRPPALTLLTEAQERELLADDKLILVTYMVLNGWDVARIVRRFQLSEAEVIRRLARLDKLGMIELLPGNRVRRRVARNFTWRRNGPVEAWFQREVQGDFFSRYHSREAERLRFVGGLLSPESLQRLHKLVDRVTNEMDDLIEADGDLPIEDKISVGAVFAARPWEVPLFVRMKRPLSAE